MAEVINTTFQLKRGLASAWQNKNPILSSGEPGWTLDTHILKIGDGVTPWNLLQPVNEGKVTEEQIQEAVNNYLKENPIIANEYFAGNGLQVNNNEFSIKLAEDSEDFLSIDENGIKLTGISDTLEEIQKYLSDELLPRLEGDIADINAKTFAVDDKTIKLTEKTEEAPVAKAYVAEVSTDILEQGTQTLVFYAGTASTVI